ncbi:GGDEF domain-containing protein [Rhodobacteraceae bacterium B1Z28]|uniref:GGDEF domain-containing protein n=1 Tax=Ruegeria haliotis TaxID=2747601 RepID=A0ABX2PUU5_9RHOB|nr:GGDEF domain-containing phosphodiesterase [Ruegeria haliotis]NVO57955.1 GGDEF domain-containing protein [Ruegeria haliotis]
MRNLLSFDRLIRSLAVALNAPSALAFIPALSLGAFWVGGERALIATALGFPLVLAGVGVLRDRPASDGRRQRLSGGLLANDQFDMELGAIFDATNRSGEDSACMAVALDDYNDLLDLHGQAAANHVAEQFCARVLSMIRGTDIATRIGGNKMLIGLRPARQLDLEACIQMSGRVQSLVEHPIILNGTGVYMSCSVGFCLHKNVSDDTAAGWSDAATGALVEAQRNGPSTIRAYSTESRRRSRIRTNLRKDFEAALDSGEIRPWFQPQISTDTGRVTGFEALARWEHPQKGVLGPHLFLPFAEQAELMERLGQTMRHHSFTAMRDWDRAGVVVPRIGVNFSSDELRDPGLIDRLKWELDQFDVTPDRLAVEVLETVFSRRPDDVITRNVTGLAALGCCIDLDDFGTGHASIASIKRFNVSRIKIDRSFVAKADQDPSQQQLASAILTMAEQLKVETLAEGVETPGEHALMAQLGCDHVQGFGIGKPMPFEKTLDWIAAYRNKINRVPKIGRQTG